MDWEQPLTRIFNSDKIDVQDKLQYFELPIRAMGIALSTCTFPIRVIDEDLKGILLKYRGEFNKKLSQQSNFFAHFDAAAISELKKDIFTKNVLAYKDLPTSFFLYCMHLLLDDTPIVKKMDPRPMKTSKKGNFHWSTDNIKEIVMNLFPSKINLIFPLKASLSLGFAMFLGLVYNKENGYWSGLIVAICFVTGRHSTFSLANARGQGTAMGSIYGVLCCFIFQRCMDIRFLPLLPWIFFSSFLMYSRMYGKAGGISTVTGALLVIGINHDENPSKFAFVRIVEATIGLICFVIVEILFNPFRASTLAKGKLSQCLRSLQHCIDQISIIVPSEKEKSFSYYQTSQDGNLKLKFVVDQLEEVTMEAELEPNFWFIPFHNGCYRKMLESLSTMVDLLLFVAYSMEKVKLLLQKDETFFMDLCDRVNENVENVKNKVGLILNCLDKITRIQSSMELEKELKNINLSIDVDIEENLRNDAFWIWNGDEEVNNITYSFLHHLEKIANKACTNTDEEMLKGQMLFHYGCLGFCSTSLMRETIKIHNEVKELLVWENPSSQTNLKEIFL